MDNEKQEKTATPMGRVWVIVASTMLATVVIGLLWHMTTIGKYRFKNNLEAQMVQQNIQKLTAYRDQLSARATSTPPIATSTKSNN